MDSDHLDSLSPESSSFGDSPSLRDSVLRDSESSNSDSFQATIDSNFTETLSSTAVPSGLKSPHRREKHNKKSKKERSDRTESNRQSLRPRNERPIVKAVYDAQISFDYEDEIPVTYKKLLEIITKLTGSEFGYIGYVKEPESLPQIPSHPLRSNSDLADVGTLVIHSIVHSGQDEALYVRQQEIYNTTISTLTDLKNVFGSVLLCKKAVFASKEEDGAGEVAASQTIPEIPILGKPLTNFVGIPLIRKAKKRRQLLGVIGLGNRKAGAFNEEFVESLRHYIGTCEVLLQAFHNFRAVNMFNMERDQMQALLKSIKDPETGFVVKDRKHHLKSFKNCFIGQEATSWLLANCEHMGVKSREDALKLGRKLHEMRFFNHVTKEHNFEDDYLFYTFEDVRPEEDLLKAPLSPNEGRRRSTSFIISNFSSLMGGGSKASMSSDNIAPVSTANDPKKYKLHAIVAKRDAYTLRKNLSKKKIIDHLNVVNQDQQTALHIAIENNDYECVELLLKSYRQHIDRVDIHVKDRNGYTPLHTASELGNEKIIIALLLHPGIQTNIGNNYYNTPFHCFCNKFSTPSSVTQIFDLWIQRGTLINVQNKGGETPLHKAILNPTMRAIMARRLVEHGADVNIKNLRDETPLHYAIHLKRKDLVYILLCGGADPDAKGKEDLVNSELEENQEIQTLLSKTRDLRSWLESIHMKNYLPAFMKHLIFKDVLHNVNEKTLIDMEITMAGDRLRILQAIDKFKDEARTQVFGSPMEKNDSVGPVKGKVRLADLRRRSPLLVHEERTVIPSPKVPRSSSSDKVWKQIDDVEVNWIQYSDLEFTEYLGSGTSGAVYRGFYKKAPVAIKVLEKDKDNKTEEFGHEFKIMSAIRGENIVHFYGACSEPKPCLVMEYCARGNLYELISSAKIQFGWREFLRFATEMTEAIDMLHSNTPQVLHRDLKSMNFLVTKDWRIKVCDFGLSRFSNNTNMSTFYQLRGTMAYCAPETFEGKQFTVASDVYSLGIIMWEMLYRCVTGEYQRPYAEYTYITQPFQIIIQAAQKGLRPTIPIIDKCPPMLVNLITACWDSVPEKRPTAKGVLAELENLRIDFENRPEEWNSCILSSGSTSAATLSFLSTSLSEAIGEPPRSPSRAEAIRNDPRAVGSRSLSTSDLFQIPDSPKFASPTTSPTLTSSASTSVVASMVRNQPLGSSPSSLNSPNAIATALERATHLKRSMNRPITEVDFDESL